jgi:hypothetical protein
VYALDYNPGTGTGRSFMVADGVTDLRDYGSTSLWEFPGDNTHEIYIHANDGNEPYSRYNWTWGTEKWFTIDIHYNKLENAMKPLPQTTFGKHFSDRKEVWGNRIPTIAKGSVKAITFR